MVLSSKQVSKLEKSDLFDNPYTKIGIYTFSSIFIEAGNKSRNKKLVVSLKYFFIFPIYHHRVLIHQQ